MQLDRIRWLPGLRLIPLVYAAVWTGEMEIYASNPETSVPLNDSRNIRLGSMIPDQGYCDQPYIVQTKDGNWLCTLTTGRGNEGDPGQHVVATISADRGLTWSEPIDIEPESGPESSWVVPLVTPDGRIYAFYDYNGDRVTGRRADMLGWYVYKYSDDNGRTWSGERYRLPVRRTLCDENNSLEGDVQIFWGIDKPTTHNGSVYFAFTKLGKYMLDLGEGWLFRSDNLLTERDPDAIRWEMLPDGERGIRAPEFGSVQEEHNVVVLDDGTLFCMYRTTTGHPCHSYSFDGGRTWTFPEHATYFPGGPKFKHNRACPAVWKTKEGNYLFWFNNHAGKTFEMRNPVWLSGGIERNGRIEWSQPEIVLYDPDPAVRISYPDLIEEDGRYWISETQKSVARIHEIDPKLLQGLWTQGKIKKVARNGLALAVNKKAYAKRTIEMPDIPNPAQGGGFTIEFWVRFDELGAGQVLFDSRNAGDAGIRIETTEGDGLKVEMHDGAIGFDWTSEGRWLHPNRRHHVVVIVDGGPKILTCAVDGVLCDGGKESLQGWARFDPALGNVRGADRAKLGPNLYGKIETLRVYTRYLRTSEAIANYHAGKR